MHFDGLPRDSGLGTQATSLGAKTTRRRGARLIDWLALSLAMRQSFKFGSTTKPNLSSSLCVGGSGDGKQRAVSRASLASAPLVSLVTATTSQLFSRSRHWSLGFARICGGCCSGSICCIGSKQTTKRRARSKLETDSRVYHSVASFLNTQQSLRSERGRDTGSRSTLDSGEKLGICKI